MNARPNTRREGERTAAACLLIAAFGFMLVLTFGGIL